MPIVYRLSEELGRDPEQIELAQALTLDPNRPLMGLKGNLGLFGSPEWWENVRSGVMPQKRRSGIIQHIYHAGQDSGRRPNSFQMICDDGEVWDESIYCNTRVNWKMFKAGKKVDILYVLDETKTPLSDDRKNYLEMVIEMSLSETN